MADFLQNLDPRNVVVLETVLSFVVSPFVAPSYNLPVFLFGIYAQEAAESNQALKLFTGLSGGSILFDIIWFSRNEQNWFIRLLCIIIFIFKIPTVLLSVTALRQRGEQFSGMGIRGADISGPTVWSMPGGFSSLAGGRNGYDNVDEVSESHHRTTAQAAPAVHVTPPSAPAAPPAPAPGGYQAI